MTTWRDRVAGWPRRFTLQAFRSFRGLSGTTVHLCNEGPAEGRSAFAGHSRRYLALLLSRREDRRARRQRRGQVVAAAHHGRRGPGLPGRGMGGEGDEDRLPAAGAAARSHEERARERGARGRRPAEAARAL